jgi:multidrug efflux system membrane fusion protein
MAVQLQVKWTMAAGLVALGIALVSYALRPPPAASEAASAVDATPIPVTVAFAEVRDLPLVLAASGRAEAKVSVTVKSRLDGQVAAILFMEGRPVRKGQVLLRMDPAPGQAQVRQTQALLARDQAQVDRLAAEAQRNTALFDQGFISKNGLGQTNADLQAARATLKADQAAIDTARLQLGFAEVIAPVDGVAGAVLLPVGGAAKANDTALVVINQVRPIYVSFAIAESELDRVKRAMARGRIAVSASVPGALAVSQGELAFLDNTVDPTTGTIIGKAVFANDDGNLTPGQFAQVKLRLEQVTGVVVVPTTAVESGVEGPYVFVAGPDSKVSLRAVKVSVAVDGFTAIASGLAAGERVVTAGQSHLRVGSRVTATPASAPARLP